MEKKNEKKPVNVRALKSGSYSLILCALALVLVIVVNLFVSVLPTSFTKLDASAIDILTLSDESKAIAASVASPVTMYLVTQQGAEDITILSLLERYADLNKNIKIEKVDPDTNPAFTSQYTTDALSPNSVIVDGEFRDYVVDYTDIYVTDYSNMTEEDYYNYIYYGIEPTGTPLFYGELMISSALDFVSAEQIPTAYYLSGHSEDPFSDAMNAYFATDNIMTEELALLTVDSIPADCSAIILNNPKTDISEYETEMLSAYLTSGGSMILITDFRYYTEERMPNLASIAATMGMKSEDGLLVEANRSNYNTYPTYLLPILGSTGPAAQLETTNLYTFITNAHGIVLTGEGSAQASPLLSTTTASYVKKAGQNLTTYEKEDGDVEGSFAVAASATNGESKFVWFSSPAIVSDQWDYYVNGGNTEVFLASVNWMCEKAVSLSILAKTMQVQALVIPESALGLWSAVLTLVLPLAILGGGFYVWMRRRRK